MKTNALLSLFAGLALALPAAAQQTPAPANPNGSIEPDGAVNVPGFRLPPSIYLSDAAKKSLPRAPSDQDAMMRAIPADRTEGIRRQMPQIMAPRLARLKEMYGVTTREATIAGVRAVYATPDAGVPAANQGKILLNLPGGGFVMGVASGTGMIESIPLAGLAKVEILSITYRQGPEYKYPAATEDVVAVYRELLKTYRPEDIAVFGCSAGGLLTAQAMAAFVKEKLPLPSAIGIFCASADGRWGGDSEAFARPFGALPPRPTDRRMGYFENADMLDPMVSPVLAPETLRRFPPTLLITATRAMEMSAAVATHRALVKAGVTTDLQLWDGLGHAFFYDPDLPESREAFDVMTAWFRKHLKLEE